jgi:hypothetical protein
MDNEERDKLLITMSVRQENIHEFIQESKAKEEEQDNALKSHDIDIRSAKVHIKVFKWIAGAVAGLLGFLGFN